MSAATYSVKTTTPTVASQLVSKINSSLYIGSTGPFDAVILSYDGSVWQYAIYMTSDPNSPYYPSKVFEQITGDPDPISAYDMLVGGSRDPSAGTGAVDI